MDQELTPHFPLDQLIRVGPHTGIYNIPPDSLAGNALLLAQKLEQARAVWSAKLGRDCPVRISYGYRSPGPNGLNAAVGSQPPSAHCLFLAADTIPDGMTLREAWEALVSDPTFMEDVDQLIIERGCVHIGLPVPAHGNIPRHELRLDQDINGVRHYPLYGYWTPQGVERA